MRFSNRPRRLGQLAVTVLAAALSVVLVLVTPPPIAQAQAHHGYPIGGRIYEAYVRVGGFPQLGNALIPESNDARGGKYQYFAAGSSIYWNQQVTEPMAYQVGGLIRDRWAASGWETGTLGYPLTDERTAPDGAGRFNFFEKGSIYWSPSTGAHIVGGQIYETWAAHGHERGTYGYPTSEEYDIPEGKAQNFQNGIIEWKQYGYDGEWQEDPSYTTTDADFDASSVGVYAAPQEIHSIDRTARSAEPPLAVTDNEAQGCQTLPSSEAGTTCFERRSLGEVDPDIAPPPPAKPEEAGQPQESPGSTTAPTVTEPSSPEVAPSQESQRSSPAPTSAPSGSPEVARQEVAEPVEPYAITPDRSWCTEQWMGGTAFACKYEGVAYDVKRLDRNGAWRVVGTITGTEYRDVLPNWRNLTTSTRYSFTVREATDEAAGTIMEASAACRNGNCRIIGGNRSVAAQPGAELEATWENEVPLAPSSAERRNLSVNIILTKAGVSAGSYDLGMTTIRCDNLGDSRATEGCRIMGPTPVFSMLDSGPSMLRHLRAAKAAGLPGFVGGRQLTRETDPQEIRWNREYSCGRVTGPRPSGLDCDEYPFASTSHVRSAWGMNKVTFSWCGIRDGGIVTDPPASTNNISSVCLLSASENRRAGAKLGWFYVKSRVLNRDLFWVSVDAP